MRGYLLGELDERHAASLEKLYFSDPAFFEWVWEMEEELITDYLDGRLSTADREHFENRYLQIPALTKRLEQVRTRVLAAPPRTFRVRWELVCAAAVLVCLATAYWFWPGSHIAAVRPPAPEIAQNRTPTPALALLTVRLAPGLIKGADSRQSEIVPPPGGKIRLILELPGVRSPIECQISLAAIGADGRRENAWVSGSLTTVPAAGGQEVGVEIDSSRLPAADYLAELHNSRGEALETYSFRVTSPAR